MASKSEKGTAASPQKGNRRKNGEGTYIHNPTGTITYQVTIRDERGKTLFLPDGSPLRKSFTAGSATAAFDRYTQERAKIIQEFKRKYKERYLGNFSSSSRSTAVRVLQDDTYRAKPLPADKPPVLFQAVPSEYFLYENNATPEHAENFISLVDWIYKYITVYLANKKASTRSSYISTLYRDIQPYFGDFPLVLVNYDVLQGFVNYLCTPAARHRPNKNSQYQGLSPKSVNNIVCIVRGAITKAAEPPLDMLKKDPTRGLELPEILIKEMRVLSEEEMVVFTYEMRRERLYMAMFISLFSGLRMGELLALEWSDFHEKERCLKICKTLIRVQVFDDPHHKTKLIVEPSAKTAAGNRRAALADQLYDMLRLHRFVQALHKTPNPHNLIFPSKKGTYTDPRTYEKRIKEVARRAGLEDVTVHTLRHTFATRLAEENVPLSVLKEIMGHSSVKMTERYLHTAQKLQAEAVNILNRYISPENTEPNSPQSSSTANKVKYLQLQAK